MDNIGWVYGETEFYNGVKWKMISEYVDGDQVMVYDENLHQVKFETPIQYNIADCEKFWKFWGQNFCECVSEDSCVSDRDGSKYESLAFLLSNPLYKQWYERYKDDVSHWALRTKLSFKDGKLAEKRVDEPYNPANKKMIFVKNGKKYNFVTSTGFFVTRIGQKVTISLGEKYAK